MNTLSSLAGHLQLRRLVILRGVAIVAQLATLTAVWRMLHVDLDWTPMLLTIAALVVINTLTLGRLRSSRPVSNPELFAQLCVDVLALSVLLYYGGGSTNPFVSLFLLPLVIAAATLPPAYSWGMAALTVASYSVLMVYFVPLPHIHHDFSEDSAFNTHVMGMWLGFVLSAGVVAYFVVQMAQAVRQRDALLAQVREEVLRNERIVALGIQAAGAAHEMGTPLSTMAVVLGELEHEIAACPDWQDSVTLLTEQVARCKHILDKILAHAQEHLHSAPQPVEQLMHEVLDEWQLLRPTAQYDYQSATDGQQLRVDSLLHAALMNLLNNAADASPQRIRLRTRCDGGQFVLEIQDDGEGLSEEALLKAGSAYFTTKREGRGLGLLLANASVERMGGSVRLYNRPGGGATTELILPLCPP